MAAPLFYVGQKDYIAKLNELVGLVSGGSTGVVIDDTAGNGSTTKTWSADKIYDTVEAAKVGTTSVAGVALSGQRVVLLDASGKAIYANCTTLSHMGRVIGITSGAVAIGAAVTIVSTGAMTEPSWAWTPDLPVFLGLTGLLTQTATTSGFLQIIGVAATATTLFVSLREPIRIA